MCKLFDPKIQGSEAMRYLYPGMSILTHTQVFVLFSSMCKISFEVPLLCTHCPGTSVHVCKLVQISLFSHSTFRGCPMQTCWPVSLSSGTAVVVVRDLRTGAAAHSHTCPHVTNVTLHKPPFRSPKNTSKYAKQRTNTA